MEPIVILSLIIENKATSVIVSSRGKVGNLLECWPCVRSIGATKEGVRGFVYPLKINAFFIIF